LRFGARAWEGTEQRIAATEQVQKTQALLRELFGNALPQPEGAYIAFEGTSRQVSFIAVAPAAFASGGTARITIDIDTPQSMKIRATAGTRAKRDITLTLNAGALRLAYLDASEKVPAWLDRWHDRDRLPAAIRIVADTQNAPARWPTFVALLPIAQPAECAFDPVSFSCRGS